MGITGVLSVKKSAYFILKTVSKEKSAERLKEAIRAK